MERYKGRQEKAHNLTRKGTNAGNKRYNNKGRQGKAQIKAGQERHTGRKEATKAGKERLKGRQGIIQK